jgi:hypothetical protein
MEVMEKKAYTYVSSATVSSAIEIDRQVTNPSTNSEIIASTESPAPIIASQLSNAADEILIQPCANFSTPFKKNFLQRTSPSSLTTLLENSPSTSSDSFRRCTDSPHSLDESDQSTRSSMFSLRDPTPPPAPTIPQVKPLSQRPSTLKKKDSAALESSLILLCQTMHQRFQDNHNTDVAGSSDETFARLIVNQLERLSSHEKQRRQQAIMQILYEPYEP